MKTKVGISTNRICAPRDENINVITDIDKMVEVAEQFYIVKKKKAFGTLAKLLVKISINVHQVLKDGRLILLEKM